MRSVKSLFLILLFVFLSSTAGFSEVVDRIVAVVNEDVITLAELEKAEQQVMAQLRQQPPASTAERERKNIRTKVLDHLIDQKLAEQEAKKFRLSVSEAELDRAIEKIIRDNGITREQLSARMQQDGVTMDEYRQKVKGQIERFKLIGQAVNAKIVITEDKLRDYYNKHQDSYAGQQKFAVQHIVFSIPRICSQEEKQAVLKKAEDVRQQAKDGADFEDLARRFSTYSTASEGGNLGRFDRDELAPYMRDIIVRLKAGEIGPVVETPIGYQIFKVVGVERTKEKTFEEVRDEIHQILFEQDVEKRFTAWIKELRERSYVEVLL